MMTIKVNQPSLKRMNALIDEMAKTTGAEGAKVVRNYARDLVRNARKVTPKAEKGIEVWSRILDKDGKIVVASDGKPIYLPARKIRKPYRADNNGRLKVRPGLSRAGWSGCLVRLGVGKNAGKSGLKFSEKSERTIKNKASLVIANAVPFIEDLESGNYINGRPNNIMQRATRMTNAQMRRRLDEWAGVIKKKFKKGK